MNPGSLCSEDGIVKFKILTGVEAKTATEDKQTRETTWCFLQVYRNKV